LANSPSNLAARDELVVSNSRRYLGIIGRSQRDQIAIIRPRQP